MPDSPQRDPRARPSVWAPFGWAAILTLILAGATFFAKNSHSLSSHIGEFIGGILLLPVALVFVLLEKVAGNFLVWLSGVPDWLLFTLITADAYLYCLIAMILLWIMIRLAKRRRSPGR
ncbi:MAG: hypothetical protein JO025_00755 [Verrucomicrobia bacterium]|nr:hypothetical protein [Verrucomicrobiota bacterium]